MEVIEAERQVLKVSPNFTSQECSNCGRIEKKTLDQRIHSCYCGFEADRDVNAAKVILGRGQCLRRDTTVTEVYQ